ncbi:MAG TPA: hypothetical protein VF530_09965, partial [Planctomycetota bacterium]
MRPAFRDLGKALRTLRAFHVGLWSITLLAGAAAFGLAPMASDPVTGDLGLLRAAGAGLLTVLFLVAGARVAFEPRAWLGFAALVGTAFLARAAWAGDHFAWVCLAGLWAAFGSTLPLARLLAAHPDSFSARRIAAMQGVSSERGLDPEVRARQLAAASRRAWRRAALPIGLFVAGFGPYLAWQRTLRPEPPEQLLAAFTTAWNAGLEPVLREFKAPEHLLEQLERLQRDGTFPRIDAVDSFGTADRMGSWLLPRSFDDPRVPDRATRVELSVAGGSATLLAGFAVTERGGPWRLVAADVLEPRLAPVLERFVAAWNAGSQDELLALVDAERSGVLGPQEFADIGAFAPDRPRLSSRRVGTGHDPLLVQRRLDPSTPAERWP